MEVKIIAGLVSLLGLIAALWCAHHDGYAEAEREYQAKIAQANADAENKLILLNARVTQKQADLNTAQQAIIDRSKELENAKQDYTDLRTKYADATLRLSVRTYRQSSPAQQNNVAAPPPGPSENVVLLPEVSTAILDFARDYSENLRMKNECIDLYQAALNAVNN